MSNRLFSPKNFIYWKTTLLLLGSLLGMVMSAQIVSVSMFEWGLDMNFFSMKISVNTMVLMFLVVVFLISLNVFFWGSFYLTSWYKQSLFYTLLFMFVGSMVTLLLSSSVTMMILGWEGLGVSSYVLIIFYQNWMSFNSGQLTLLTNRLGDAMMMLLVLFLLQMSVLSYWALFVLGLIAYTKSAQWPFFSWLPAAMAAPTPVSALVHSSTLVTAGIWILCLHIQPLKKMSFILSSLGIVTLLVASMAALKEADMKKVVALSTLSQLGFMTLSLSLGGAFVVFPHILSHALAKANLFLVVGKVLFESYSEQDFRKTRPSLQPNILMLCLAISVFSLSGVAYFSGFYSKEQVLLSSVCFLNSGVFLITFLVALALTLTYSIKLALAFSVAVSTKTTKQFSMSSGGSPAALSTLTLIWGFYFSSNAASPALQKAMEGIYWLLWLLSPIGIFLGSYSFFNSVNVGLLPSAPLKTSHKMESLMLETLTGFLVLKTLKGAAVTLLFPLCTLLFIAF